MIAACYCCPCHLGQTVLDKHSFQIPDWWGWLGWQRGAGDVLKDHCPAGNGFVTLGREKGKEKKKFPLGGK